MLTSAATVQAHENQTANRRARRMTGSVRSGSSKPTSFASSASPIAATTLTSSTTRETTMPYRTARVGSGRPGTVGVAVLASVSATTVPATATPASNATNQPADRTNPAKRVGSTRNREERGDEPGAESTAPSSQNPQPRPLASKATAAKVAHHDDGRG